jgi:CheY-like chemotaxis protein
MHGGTIGARSEGLDRGATFTVRLPLTAANEPASPAAMRLSDQTLECTPRRVLIVDDNADAADSLCSLLQLSGHQVRTVYRGDQALEQIRQFCPDVVLLDIGLPDLDGYEIARRVRTELGTRRPTLVALSGWGRSSDKQQAREAGIDLHLTKPVDAETLQRVLEEGHAAN